jgi:hypothetical protein
VGDGEAADEAVLAIEAAVPAMPPGGVGFFLPRFSVQRPLRSILRVRARFQSSGMPPPFTTSFSACVRRGRRASTMVASTETV